MASLFSADTTDETNTLRERMLAKATAFLQSGRVFDGLNHEALVARFASAELPETTGSITDYLENVISEALPSCVNTGSPRCLGHMTGAVARFAHPLNELILMVNQNQVKQEASLSFSVLERQTLAMLHRLVYHRNEEFYATHSQSNLSTLGIMASGSTLANITALWIARNLAFAPTNGSGGPEKNGLAASLQQHGCRGAVIIGSRLMHYSIDKAAALLGLGSRNVLKLPVDAQAKIDLGVLRKTIVQCRAENVKILALIGTAGTTDCGNVDCLADLAALASEHAIHFHVDAAWGTALLFSRKHRSRLDGIEQADSVTLDGHKQLHLPIGASLLVLRDPMAASVIEKEANYMLHEKSSDLGKRSLEGSRAAYALFLHGALHVFGRQTYEALVDHNISTATKMARRIRDRADFELLMEPETNIVLYRYLPHPWRGLRRNGDGGGASSELINLCNERLQQCQAAAGRSFVARTRIIQGANPEAEAMLALRAVIVNPSTTESDLVAILQEQAEIGEQTWSALAPCWQSKAGTISI